MKQHIFTLKNIIPLDYHPIKSEYITNKGQFINLLLCGIVVSYSKKGI